jgi:hypothetical protein
MPDHLAGSPETRGSVGRAQEKTSLFRTEKRRDKEGGSARSLVYGRRNRIAAARPPRTATAGAGASG